MAQWQQLTMFQSLLYWNDLMRKCIVEDAQAERTTFQSLLYWNDLMRNVS